MVGTCEFMDIVNTIGFPNYGYGRIMKVGREEMVGLYSAVKQYLSLDHIKRHEWCEAEVEKIVKNFRNSKLFNVSRSFPNEAGQPIPRAQIDIVDEVTKFDDVYNFLINREKGIYVMEEGTNIFYINPMTLYPGEVEEIIVALNEFSERRK